MINSIVSQGLIWAILGLGIFMTFRILDFPDMTTEGSFPLGGAVAVTLITKGVNPLFDAGCYWCRVFGGTCDGSSLHKRENTDTLVRDPCNDIL